MFLLSNFVFSFVVLWVPQIMLFVSLSQYFLKDESEITKRRRLEIACVSLFVCVLNIRKSLEHFWHLEGIELTIYSFLFIFLYLLVVLLFLLLLLYWKITGDPESAQRIVLLQLLYWVEQRMYDLLILYGGSLVFVYFSKDVSNLGYSHWKHFFDREYWTDSDNPELRRAKKQRYKQGTRYKAYKNRAINTYKYWFGERSRFYNKGEKIEVKPDSKKYWEKSDVELSKDLNNKKANIYFKFCLKRKWANQFLLTANDDSTGWTWDDWFEDWDITCSKKRRLEIIRIKLKAINSIKGGKNSEIVDRFKDALEKMLWRKESRCQEIFKHGKFDYANINIKEYIRLHENSCQWWYIKQYGSLLEEIFDRGDDLDDQTKAGLRTILQLFYKEEDGWSLDFFFDIRFHLMKYKLNKLKNPKLYYTSRYMGRLKREFRSFHKDWLVYYDERMLSLKHMEDFLSKKEPKGNRIKDVRLLISILNYRKEHLAQCKEFFFG